MIIIISFELYDVIKATSSEMCSKANNGNNIKGASAIKGIRSFYD